MNVRFMMSAVLPDVIDECILSCSLCLQEAHQPKLLPCLHVFCQLCLRNYAEQCQEKQQQKQQQQQQKQQRQQKQQQQQQQKQQRQQNQQQQQLQQKRQISTGMRSSFDCNSQSSAWTGLDDHDVSHYDTPADPDTERGERKDGDGTGRRSLERAKDRAVSPEMGDFYRSRYKLHRFEEAQSEETKYLEDDYEIPDVNDIDRPVSCELGPARKQQAQVGQDDPNHGHKRSQSDLTYKTRGERSKVGKSESSSSLSGHVSSMVHIFERKSSESQQTPPMAKFRTKERRPSRTPSAVPLSQRTVPVYRPQDPSTAQPDHGKCTSAGRVLRERESLTEHQYEIPECRQSVHTAVTPLYELATATESILRHPNLAQNDRSSVGGARPSNLHLDPSSPPVFTRTPSEHIYDEITSVCPTDGANLHSPTRCLLREHRAPKSKDDHDLPRSRRSIRRNSSILDSYVMAGALASLCTDDTTRLSELYLRMDSATPDRRSRTSQRYVSMEQLAIPDHVESIATLIRAISSEFGNLRSPDDAKTEKRGTSEVEKIRSAARSTPPPVYVNVSPRSQSVSSDDPELDAVVPVCDTPSTPISPYQYLAAPLKKTEGRQEDEEDTPGSEIPCPVCCRLFTMPNQLKDCPFISQLEDVVSSQKCERKTCGNCEARDAAFKCLDCFVYLCHGCRSGHNWSMANRGHKVMTLQQLQSGKYQADMKRSQKTYCEKDHTNEAKYICAQCKHLLCSDCVLLHCKNHHTRCIDDVAKRDKDFIEAKLRDLQHDEDRMNGAVDCIQMYQHHCVTSRDHILDQLAAQQDYIKSLVDQAFDLLRAEVKDTFAAEYRNVSDVKRAVQSSVASVRHVTKFTNQLLLHGNHGNVVALAPIIKEQLRRIEEVGHPRMTSQLEVKYVPQRVEIESIQKLCGHIAPVMTKLDSTQHGANTYEFVKQNMVVLEPCQEFHTKVASDNKGCRPNGLTMLPGGHLVIADNINMKLKCFDTRGRLRWEICPDGSQMLVDPWDVTVLSDGTIAVTDKGTKTVKLFRQDGQFVTAYGSHLSEPWGICTNSRREVLVTDTKLRRVFVHDPSGRLLNTIPARGVPKGFALECPEYITCNTMDDIVVSDFEKHSILVYDMLGRPLFTFGRKGTGFDQFYYPLGVTADVEGNIYAVNYKNQRITVITGNGTLICCLTTKEPMQSLQAITVDPKGHLVVIDGSKVKIFPLPRRITAIAADDVSSDHRNDKPVARSDILILKNDDEEEYDDDVDDGGELDRIMMKETTV